MSSKHKANRQVLIITGPTASGKTSLSLKIAEYINGQIINADVGQLYKPLCIGTAKPNWKNEPAPHHLFDVLDTPTDLSVRSYRERVLGLMEKIWQEGGAPIIVGGSQFYIKSLYFPLHKQPQTAWSYESKDDPRLYDPSDTWDKLNEIDPARATNIHPHDQYRISRALDLWRATGKVPSSFEPVFNPEFNSLIVYIDRDKKQLDKDIALRTQIMFDQGWIEETQKIMGTPWELFLAQKKLIGYPEIISWLAQGRPCSEKELQEAIVIKTRQYAKRQRTFWQSLSRLLTKQEKSAPFQCAVREICSSASSVISTIINHFEQEGRG